MFVNLLFVRRVYQADAVEISFVLFLFLPPFPLWPTSELKMITFFAVLCSKLKKNSVRSFRSNPVHPPGLLATWQVD